MAENSTVSKQIDFYISKSNPAVRNYLWKKNRKEFVPDSRVRVSNSGEKTSLVFYKPQRGNSGVYSVSVSGLSGTATAWVRVIIQCE